MSGVAVFWSFVVAVLGACALVFRRRRSGVAGVITSRESPLLDIPVFRRGELVGKTCFRPDGNGTPLGFASDLVLRAGRGPSWTTAATDEALAKLPPGVFRAVLLALALLLPGVAHAAQAPPVDCARGCMDDGMGHVAQLYPVDEPLACGAVELDSEHGWPELHPALRWAPR